MSFLTVENLVVNYGAIKAVQGISLHVEEGEVITLLGANGAGKSSTINALVHLVEAADGKITFRGNDITHASTAAIVKMGVSQSMEGRQVFPRMSVLENLKMGGYTCGKEQIQEGIERAFSLFPILKERSGQPAGTLSGGEQQMLSLGRALMTNPKLLLLDEPSLGLAPLIVRQVFEIVQEINSRFKTTILLAEQNAKAALSISDRGYVLEKGKVKFSDNADALLHSKEVIEAYLGG